MIDNLSQITTDWNSILAVQRSRFSSQGNSKYTAQHEILRRYGGSIYHYLLGATKNSELAAELSQEFAYRFLRGDLHNVNPKQGRFRDYLKTVLRNIVNEFQRKRMRENAFQLGNSSSGVKIEHLSLDQTNFNESWRQNLLGLAWIQLEAYELEKSNHYYRVLRYRADHPELDSTQLAAGLSESLHRTVSPEWVRQNLRRARIRFGIILLEEIKKTLPEDALPDEIEGELAELRLLNYVQRHRRNIEPTFNDDNR